MYRGSGMRGERNVICSCQNSCFEKPAETGTPCRIRLKNVNRAGFEHGSEVRRIETVLAGSNIHACRRSIPNQTQTWQIVGRDRLLEPAHIVIGKSLGKFQSLFPIVSAIRINEEL